MKYITLGLVKTPIHHIYGFLVELGAITRFTGTALFSAFSPPYKRSITLRQMDEIGVGSLPLVMLTGLFM